MFTQLLSRTQCRFILVNCRGEAENKFVLLTSKSKHGLSAKYCSTTILLFQTEKWKGHLAFTWYDNDCNILTNKEDPSVTQRWRDITDWDRCFIKPVLDYCLWLIINITTD